LREIEPARNPVEIHTFPADPWQREGFARSPGTQGGTGGDWRMYPYNPIMTGSGFRLISSGFTAII